MCKSINGSLLEVNDIYEHRLIEVELQNLDKGQNAGGNVTYWTGLNDMRDEGTFVWTDSLAKPNFAVGCVTQRDFVSLKAIFSLTVPSS